MLWPKRHVTCNGTFRQRSIERQICQQNANNTKVFTKFSTVSLCDYICNIFTCIYRPIFYSTKKPFHSSDALLLCFCFRFTQYNYFVVIFPMIFSSTICWSYPEFGVLFFRRCFWLLLFLGVVFSYCFGRFVAIAAQGNSEPGKKHTEYRVYSAKESIKMLNWLLVPKCSLFFFTLSLSDFRSRSLYKFQVSRDMLLILVCVSVYVCFCV